MLHGSKRPTGKYLLIAIALMVAIGGFYLGRQLWKGDAEGAPGGFAMPVETVKVTPRPLDVTIDSVGTLAANE